MGLCMDRQCRRVLDVLEGFISIIFADTIGTLGGRIAGEDLEIFLAVCAASAVTICDIPATMVNATGNVVAPLLVQRLAWGNRICR